MTHFEMLKEILDGQKERGIKSGDWDRCEYKVFKEKDRIQVEIHSVCVGFSFTKDGRFEGIFNWQE